MVRIEVIFSQLIFDHALRVRVNTAQVGRLGDKGKKAGKGGKDKDKKKTSAPNGVTNGSVSASSTTAVEPVKPAASPAKEISNQAGRISNLLPVDIKNLLNSVDT